MTYHRVTLDVSEQQTGIEALFTAMDAFPEINVLLTFPNADTHGRALIQAVKRYARQPKRVYLTESLGRVRYLSALAALC